MMTNSKEMTRISVTISAQTKSTLEKLANIESRSVSSLLTSVIESYAMGIENVCYECLEGDLDFSEDIIDVFLERVKQEHARRVATRIDLIRAEIYDAQKSRAKED